MSVDMVEEFFSKKVNEEVEKRINDTVRKNYHASVIDLFRLVKHRRDEARELYDDFVQGELTVNSIEAEGAYRTLLTLYNEMLAYHIPEGLENEINRL